MEESQMQRQGEQTARWMGWGIRFFLAAALTASRTAGDYAPFALGSVAAAGGGIDGGAALLGAALGALIFMEFSQALPFLAAGILILTAATALQGTALERKPVVLPVASGVLVMAVGGMYVVQSLSPAEQVMPCLAAAVLTGASAWYFRDVLQPDRENAPAEGAVFLAAALLLAVTDVAVGPVSVGRSLLCTLLTYVAYERPRLQGVTAGLGLGLAADLCSGSTVFTAAYGLGMLASATRRSRSRTALWFLAGTLAAALPSRETVALSLLGEAIVGGVVFLLLPGRCFGGKRIRREEPAPTEEGGVGNRLHQQLNKAAAALRDLYDSMGRNVPQLTEENPAIIFDRAAEKVCRECALCRLCWQKEYMGTFNALNDATPYLLERGRAMAKDFPAHFAARCIHMPDFITAVNGELSAFLLRRQYRRQLEETRRSAKGQYAQLSELLTATAAGLERAVEVSAVGELCRIGAALRPKEGERVCGDTVVAFHTESGRCHMLLSDGMGSGEEARRESALTCRLLRQFLEAEIAPEAALKTLNAAMALRGAETGSFTTIDLCTCRESTREVTFYKFGAAPSYVKRQGSVRRVTGSSLPAGLRGAPAAPDVTRLQLEGDSFVVMISDGVADPAKDDWLQDLLAGWQGEDPQALAAAVLRESVARETLQDDCAVQVLYCPEGEIKEV